MFVSKPRKAALTLFCCLALVLSVATVAEADSLNHAVARDHVALNRMIRKRISLPDLLPGFPGTSGAASDPPTFPDNNQGADNGSNNGSSTSAPPASTAASDTVAPSSTSDTQSGTSSAASSAASSASSSAASSAASSSASSSASASSSSASSSADSATPSQSSSASPSNQSSPSPTPTQNSQSQGGGQQQQQQQQHDNTPTNVSNNNAGSDGPQSTVFGVVTESARPTSDDATVPTQASTSVPKTAITVIAVIAGCVAAVFIGWTIIRKWKFKPSSSFEDRMTPIDWQQPTMEERDNDIPGSLRRTASAASHGSFHSSSAHGDNYGHGYGAPSLQPIPDHDFTAGSTTLAPVGGYADLARGPSPQPHMADLNRGPSMNHPAYDSYGVPLHHQGAYDYNTGARY